MTPAHDVILVGGGGAGLRAAIAIAEANPASASPSCRRSIRCGVTRCRPKAAPPA